MTAPLYDVKARFSEYVTMAEEGEVIEITKHGNATTVMISIKTYNDLNSDYKRRNRPSFMDQVRKWREETGGLTQDEAEEYADLVERLVQEDKKVFDTGVNAWD